MRRPNSVGPADVGLDRQAAKHAFADFLDGRTSHPSWNSSIWVIDHLTDRGVMDPKRLYESPFIDVHSKGVDGGVERADVVRLIRKLREIEPRNAT